MGSWSAKLSARKKYSASVSPFCRKETESWRTTNASFTMPPQHAKKIPLGTSIKSWVRMKKRRQLSIAPSRVFWEAADEEMRKYLDKTLQFRKGVPLFYAQRDKYKKMGCAEIERENL